MKETIFDFTARSGNGAEVPFSQFRGKALLIVNTASRCGFTPQYRGLEDLHKAYEARGLAVIGFPCDQFAHQEPGSDAEIAEFCSLNFGVTFPLMAKTKVNGKDADPVFKFLKKRAPLFPISAVRWNFTKFLVSPDGITVRRFSPTAEPASLAPEIEKVLPR